MQLQDERRPPPRRRRLVGRLLAFWVSRPLLLAVVVSMIAAGFAFGGVKALSWMETAAFCGQCHTMDPEVRAHLNSPHETVECAECHVGAGPGGFVKAKLQGFRQLIDLTLGEYAKPIPPAADSMPPASETCLRCHDPARQRENLLVMRSRYSDDGHNTEQRVALVVRLAGDHEQQTSGIHWHVLSKVEYVARDDEGRIIDWIGVERPDGSREEFIAENIVDISDQAGRRADALKQSGTIKRMTCYDCHNRVGHEFRPPTRAIDQAIANAKIDSSIPFIKKNAQEVISARYASLTQADAALRDLLAVYHRDYPRLFLEAPQQLLTSLDTLARIYRQTSSPEMQAFPDDYPSYLGHTDSAGCFRCHDGGHNKIEDGRILNETIPSRCSLCHTFPSVGPRTPNVMLGPPPATHNDRLWVFEHKNAAASDGTVCSACHSLTYCQNCHSTGATQVKHDNMLFDHASVIREASEEACSFCHQKPFCDRCHKEDEEAVITSAREAPP